MALLLQCLREVRTLSGDLDLIPPSARGDPLDVRHPPRNHGDLCDASSRFEFDEALGYRGSSDFNACLPESRLPEEAIFTRL
jgi:hypothetical protein